MKNQLTYVHYSQYKNTFLDSQFYLTLHTVIYNHINKTINVKIPLHISINFTIHLTNEHSKYIPLSNIVYS